MQKCRTEVGLLVLILFIFLACLNLVCQTFKFLCLQNFFENYKNNE